MNNTLVTGGTGMVGKSLQKVLPDARYVGSQDCNLMSYAEVDGLFKDCKPNAVVHLAAKAGGIFANAERPYEFFYNNIIMNSHLIHACLQNNVGHLVAMSTVCVYSPEIDQFPILEEWSQKGRPDDTLYGYAYAKRMIPVQLECMRKQFPDCNLSAAVIHASNLYGPHDCFEDGKSHVVAALLRRFHENINKPDAELFGTGKALRQVTFVDDVTKFIAFCLDKKLEGEMNFASPDNLSIKEIAESIATAVGFNGELKFNGKLDGIMRRDVSVEKVVNAGFDQFTSFDDGIRKTYSWFKEEQL